MARNEHFRDADKLSVPVPPGVKSGEPVMIGPLPGVAVTDRDDATGMASVWFCSAWDLPVTGAITAVLQKVYITPERSLTATATGNLRWGYALELKGSGVGTVPVIESQQGAPGWTAS